MVHFHLPLWGHQVIVYQLVVDQLQDITPGVPVHGHVGTPSSCDATLYPSCRPSCRTIDM